MHLVVSLNHLMLDGTLIIDCISLSVFLPVIAIALIFIIVNRMMIGAVIGDVLNHEDQKTSRV